MRCVTEKRDTLPHGRRGRGRVSGQVVKRYDVWPRVSGSGLTEQRLCWQYMDEDMSEDAWDRLCDRLAGPICGTKGA